MEVTYEKAEWLGQTHAGQQCRSDLHVCFSYFCSSWGFLFVCFVYNILAVEIDPFCFFIPLISGSVAVFADVGLCIDAKWERVY